MSEELNVITCTNCGVRLKVKSSARKVRCTKCQTVIDATRPLANSPDIHQERIAGPVQTPPLGFLSYMWRSYSQTHTPMSFVAGLILGVLLVPTLSFFKPLIGVTTMFWGFVAALAGSAGLFIILEMIAVGSYLFGKQRTISSEQRSWLSATICFLVTLAPPLGVVTLAETFGPQEGLVVKLLPQIKRDQVRLLGSLDNKNVDELKPDPEAEPADESSVAETTKISKSPPADKPIEVAQAEPNIDSPTKTKRSSRDSEASASAKGNATSSNANAATGQVIAEGVGATADEAIKDAFRNAVRQVVGTVVDAETLVKNDEVIEDEVLTYSGGFIKGYEEVDGSKKVKGGLHRIKIKAQVERRSVIAKLKAANVTVKEVDGKGLFAKAVTQLDAEKDAASLLKKQFEGFPQSCITATIIGEPETVETTGEKATLKFTVQIEPDLKAYKAFADKLIPVLDKLAKDKGEFTAKYVTHPDFKSGVLFWTGERERNGYLLRDEWMPKLFDENRILKEDQVPIAVATNRTKAADRIDYKYYLLDTTLQTVLKAVSFREGHCKLLLFDAEGEIVATDRFEPVEQLLDRGASFNGSLVVARGRPTNSYGPIFTKIRKDDSKAKLLMLFIAPVFGSFDTQKPVLTISRSLTLSLDELKSVQDAKVEITFDE